MTTHRETYETGMRIRREVLGDAHVDRSLEQASDFARPMQEFVTEYCWGVVWADETLERRTRSMLNIAILSVLNQPHELGAHVRGALTNGVTPDEIRAVIKQTAIYAGVPVALAATRVADQVIGEHGA